MNEARKRLFVLLLAFSLLALVLIFAFAWWLVSKQSLIINQIILTLTLVFFIVVFLIISIGVILLIYSLWSLKIYRGSNILIRKAIDFLFPIAIKLGHWLGIEDDKIKSSYIQVSNALVKLEQKTILPEKILILAPHCLQRVQCPHKITVNVNNCKCCGLCPVGDLLLLSQERGVQLVVATGGTFARKFIKEKKPQAIIAIACERDLTSGIQDVECIPVMGIVNERPEGPCQNTRVNLCRVEKAINYFVQGGEV
ncbi:MAG: uncharacterized protein PWQ67_707 [Clostridia bacterium]|jgi:hypothetical protein|nr:uncharacterized protein [Clostridia bacterium]MDN5322253.1 uncharacterized protein [Clostridia bacterium]